MVRIIRTRHTLLTSGVSGAKTASKANVFGGATTPPLPGLRPPDVGSRVVTRPLTLSQTRYDPEPASIGQMRSIALTCEAAGHKALDVSISVVIHICMQTVHVVSL